jgi:ferredoxin
MAGMGQTAAITITLAGQEWRFVAQAQSQAQAPETVLQAADRAGIRLPSSCRNGTCRTCICLSTSGTVRYKREGYILPCVAIAETDLVIQAPAAGRLPAPPHTGA